MTVDPRELLGVGVDATEVDVVEARRRLAREFHPDRGGAVADMQAVNAAADHVLAEIRQGRAAPSTNRPGPRRPPVPGWHGGSRRVVDHPSFTVETLPVDAFEGLLVVAAELGTVLDEDPPYRLEFSLDGDPRGWCEVTLVPDAGATTASVVVAAEPGYPAPSVELVRDLLVAGLNRLDWADESNQPRP